MKRSRVTLGALALVLLLAGCATGPTEVPDGDLTGNASYDWDADATVALNVSHDSYTAVYDIENRSHLELYSHDALGSEQPLNIQAIRFRFENGTVVTANHSEFSVTRSNSRMNVSFPARDGLFAYSGNRNGKEFTTAVFVEGSYEATLPTSARVDVPLLSRVSPGGYDQSIENGRVVLRWDDVTGSSVHLRWYLELDLLLFTTIVVVAVGLGVGGTLYYVRQIRRLERRRKDLGIDVEYEDDDIGDDGPPPGMR